MFDCAVSTPLFPKDTPAGIYMFKVKNKNTITRCEIGVVQVSFLLTLNIFQTLF